MLAAGEQAHVEFKSRVPSSIAQQAAAGANYVALNPAVDVHTILIGVEEEALANGARRGRAVGCRDEAGQPEDLDQLRLKIEQKIRDSVVPPPNIKIFEEGTATPAPILVVEVRPTDPPHRVGDRYQIRGTAGLTPLTQHDALQLFRNQRTRAWIDELEPGNPLVTVLTALQSGYEDLAFQLSDLSHSREAGEGRDWIGEALDGAMREFSDIRTTLERIEESSSHAEHRSGEILAHLDHSAEKVWYDLRNRRETRWLGLQRRVADSGYPKDYLRTITLFVRQHLSEEPALTDYARNLAELHGYDLTFRIEVGGDLDDGAEAVAEFVSAAVCRAEGVPRRFSPDWITEGAEMQRRMSDPSRWLSTGRKQRKPRTAFPREIAILTLSDEGKQALADHAWAVTAPADLAIRWETDQGVLRCGRTTAGQTVAAIYQPRWGVEGVRPDLPRTSNLFAQITRLIRQYEGAVLPIEGAGKIFAHPAAGAN